MVTRPMEIDSDDGLDDFDQVPETCDEYHGLIYQQRLESFTTAGWPIVENGSKTLLTPHELAMAGLEFSKEGEAKCVVCHRDITGLTARTNPWEAHKERNPNCPLITLGKPDQPDGYKLDDFYKLIVERSAQFLEYRLESTENLVKRQLKMLVQEELDVFKNQQTVK